jgi:hypothetical protein
LLIDGYLLNFFHESANEKKSKQPIHGRNLTDNRLLTRIKVDEPKGRWKG